MYTNIIINKNDFSIIESEQKPEEESARGTLLRIEAVIEQQLICENGLSEHELYATLRERAEAIRDGYIEKAERLSLFTRFFSRVFKKEMEIQAIFDRIVNLIESPPPFSKLPNELIQNIFKSLPINDLHKVARIDKHSEIQVKQVEIQRAQNYGYRGQDFAEAKNYLCNLFQSISTLAEDGYIPEEYIVRRGWWPFWRYIDSEVTFRNAKSYWLTNDSNINQTNRGGKTALHWAAYRGHAEVVRVLLENGADPNTLNPPILAFP